jgi:murein DD-endopeptidase MepM/ murein hydrolase activator NlpD
VTGKNFLREDIALDKSMTELRDSYDPRKVKEARIMLALLRTSMPRAIYDTEFPYQQPLTEAVVSSHFGDRRTFLYSDGGSARAIHFGVDLVKPKGWPVKASGTGKVAFADQRILTGKSVVLEHLPGVYSLYYHLDSVTVDEGALVDRGAVVGTVGSTGLVTGAHLHWEIRVAAVPVNPYSFVQGNLLDKNEILSIISSKHFTKGR